MRAGISAVGEAKDGRDTVDPAAQLIEAVRIVAPGDLLIAPAVTKRLIETFILPAPSSSPPPELQHLTPQEPEV
jgi:hypothetical protein